MAKIQNVLFISKFNNKTYLSLNDEFMFELTLKELVDVTNNLKIDFMSQSKLTDDEIELFDDIWCDIREIVCTGVYDNQDAIEYADDVDLLRLSFKSLGIQMSHHEAFCFWQQYSYDMDAGWIIGGVDCEFVRWFIKENGFHDIKANINA